MSAKTENFANFLHEDFMQAGVVWGQLECIQLKLF